MISDNNELMIVKNAVFMLLCQLESNLAEHISKDKIDSQAIFALTKLVDSFVKLSQTNSQSKANDAVEMPSDDKELLKLYDDAMKLKMAPRAGLEPATERLTAVCSTTELPGNGVIKA